jgi:hypothetical protein
MTNPDNPGAGELREAGQSSWTRTRIAVGVAGLAALLGTGAYVITDHVTDRSAATTDVGALARQAPGSSAASGSTGPATGASGGGPSASQSQASVRPSIPAEVVAKIQEAREKMARDGVKVDRPVVPRATMAASDVESSTTGSLKEGGILRLVTARGDLTGERELAYVAGGVERHRGVPCSQTFKFSTNPTPAKRVNLLMCWRTSAKKSVVAMVVDPEGHPSPDKAVDALEKKWRSMG